MGGQRLVYDSAARLLRLEPPGQASVAYTFGPNGWRQSRSDALGTVYYLFDERPLPGDVAGGRVLRESDRSGVILREFVYLPEDPLPLAWTEGGRATFPLDDGAGSVRLLTDPAGNVLARSDAPPGQPALRPRLRDRPSPPWLGE